MISVITPKTADIAEISRAVFEAATGTLEPLQRQPPKRLTHRDRVTLCVKAIIAAQKARDVALLHLREKNGLFHDQKYYFPEFQLVVFSALAALRCQIEGKDYTSEAGKNMLAMIKACSALDALWHADLAVQAELVPLGNAEDLLALIDSGFELSGDDSKASHC